MNMNMINKLMAKLPEGEKKEALRQKLQALQTKFKKRGGDGLQDTFEFQPKGHIKIEAIDEHGNVVGTLADQPNLVVEGAEEILLRSFSGDPNRILYKNRKVKDESGETAKIYIPESKLGGEALLDGEQLLHAPNVLWEEVNDDQFEISYGFYPTTVYVKEEESTEVGKKAFSLSNTPGTGRVPMAAEIYSTYTNLFIGIGEGKNDAVSLTDKRLSYSDNMTVAADRAEATAEGEELSFTEKISNFVLEVEASKDGAQIDVFINGVLKETIEAFDSDLAEPESRVFAYDGLSAEAETSVRIVHSGSEDGVQNPVMAITGLRMDALHKGMNRLMKEFTNFETVFDTPAMYNTTPMAPYTIQLPHHPVTEGTVAIRYEGIEFHEVASVEELTDTSFVVDHFRGVVTFNRALTGVMVTFEVTGELFDTEKVSTMTSGTVEVHTVSEVEVNNATPTGAVNDENTNFTLAHTPKEGTLVVKIDDVETEEYTLSGNVVVLAAAPTLGQVVTVSYKHEVENINNRPANVYKAELPITAGTVTIVGEDGVEFTLAETPQDFGNGKFILDEEDPTLVKMGINKADGQPLARIEISYASVERPGVPTNYTRAIIEKPKTINEYPWFELDKGAVKFVAEFPELQPAHNITIREMGLFDGPRVEDGIAGFRNYPVKAFSLVRVGETRKEVNTGIRITWTITLLNSDGNPFQGGQN